MAPPPLIMFLFTLRSAGWITSTFLHILPRPFTSSPLSTNQRKQCGLFMFTFTRLIWRSSLLISQLRGVRQRETSSSASTTVHWLALPVNFFQRAQPARTEQSASCFGKCHRGGRGSLAVILFKMRKTCFPRGRWYHIPSWKRCHCVWAEWASSGSYRRGNERRT